MSGEHPEAKDQSVTWELAIHFAGKAGELRRAAACKRAVLQWLAARGVNDLVEGYVDGIETPLTAVDASEEEDAAPVLAYLADKEAAHALAAELSAVHGSILSVRVSELKDVAWASAWDVDLTRLETRRCLVIVGSAHDAEASSSDVDFADGEEERVTLRLDSGVAFGDGRHATTQAILSALEDELEARSGARVLDVGTGNGVLALAAMKLGASHVVATEIDEAAIFEAASNLARNGIEVEGETARVELRKDASIPRPQLFDIVVANILAPVLVELMPDMAASLAPGGTLLLAGFIQKEAEAIVNAAAACELEVISQTDVRGWLALGLRRTRIAADAR